MRNRADDVVLLVEEIGKEDHQGAAADGIGDAMERIRRAGFRGGLEALQRGQRVIEMGEGISGADVGVDLIRVNAHAHRVLCLHDHVPDRGREMACVIVFGLLPLGGVSHRRAAVDDKIYPEIGFVLISPDEVAVCAAEDLPVEVLWVIARVIVAMLGKFGARSFVRAAMPSGEGALDDIAGVNDEAAELVELGGLEKTGDAVGMRIRGRKVRTRRVIMGNGFRNLASLIWIAEDSLHFCA